MSGGSLDYVYIRVQDAAVSIRNQTSAPHLRAFASHLELVAKALHSVEWMLSCDTSPGDEMADVMRVISRVEVLEQAANDIREAVAAAEIVLKEIQNAKR